MKQYCIVSLDSHMVIDYVGGGAITYANKECAFNFAVYMQERTGHNCAVIDIKDPVLKRLEHVPHTRLSKI